MSEDEVNHSQVGNVFMLGAGGVVAVALSAYFGRYPVLFWFIVLALATSAWCAAATTFESFMAARILNGFFSTVAQGVSIQSPIHFVCNLLLMNTPGWPHVHQR
jgi:predicted MFS family arabinose efflux permease